MEFHALGDDFAAIVTGVVLSEDLDSSMVAQINDGMDRYGVLVFHAQPLSQSEQVSFASKFGELDLGLRKAGLKSNDKQYSKTRFDYEEIMDISNVDIDGQISSPEGRRALSNFANQLWHSDSSFQTEPVSYSMLSAVVCPPSGGNTEFADMRAAYDALDEEMKARINDLSAEHFAFHSREMLGAIPSEEERAAIPPVVQPLVRKDKRTGRNSLFIGAHASRVEGMPTPQARVLLNDLLEHATQPRFVYRHRWRPGDFVIWDNRTTLHRGRHFDTSQRRELRRITIRDASTT